MVCEQLTVQSYAPFFAVTIIKRTYGCVFLCLPLFWSSGASAAQWLSFLTVSWSHEVELAMY